MFIHAGGGIALVKALWLGLCIYYWFFLPSLFLAVKELPQPIKIMYKFLLCWMLFRLVIELYLMYVLKIWHPYMGLTHNAITFIVITTFLYAARSLRLTILYKNMIVTIGMLIPESVFAWYMLTYVRKSDSMIFYVPDTAEHQLIIAITWLVSILVIIWQIYFAKLWIYEKAQSTNV